MVASATLSCQESLPPGVGAVIWSVPGKSAGTPAFDDVRAYFLDRRHELVALDKRTGALRWRSPTGETVGVTEGQNVVIAGSLVVAGDVDVHAFDRATGARRWRFRAFDGFLPGLFHLATDGERIYAGSPSGHVHAIAPSGNAIWTRHLEPGSAISAYSPVHHEGRLYVCLNRWSHITTGGIVALDALTGAEAWRREFPAKPPNHEAGCMSQVAVAGRVVVGATRDGHLYAFDRTSGESLWSAPQLTGVPEGIHGNPYMDWRPLAASAGVVVAGSTTGWVVGLDLEAGTELWRRNPQRGSIFHPIAADNRSAYLVDGGLGLIAMDLATGTILWARAGEGTLHTARPVVDGDRIFVGGPDHFSALRR